MRNGFVSLTPFEFSVGRVFRKMDQFPQVCFSRPLDAARSMISRYIKNGEPGRKDEKSLSKLDCGNESIGFNRANNARYPLVN